VSVSYSDITASYLSENIQGCTRDLSSFVFCPVLNLKPTTNSHQSITDGFGLAPEKE